MERATRGDASRTRVLQVIGGSEFGGAIWVIASYIEALQQHDCDVAVCTSVPRVAEFFESAGCEIVSIPEMVRQIHPLKDAAALAKLTAASRRGRFDVVHTHTSKGGFVGRAAARLARVPIVLHTAHGFAFHETSSPREIRFYAGLERLAARWSDRVITVSSFHRDWALRLRIAPADKLVVIRNGISPDRVRHSIEREEMRKRLNIGPTAPILTSIARLAPQKGLECLLDAMPQIVKSQPETQLVIVGDGPLRNSLESLTRRLVLTGNVHFLGFRTDVGDILNATDIVVAPSRWEGLSISLLEAMACSKPIVTTDIGSNLEIIEDGVSGSLVRPDDPAALADAVLALIDHPSAAAAYSRAAHDRFGRDLTDAAMKDSLWRLYAQLLQKARRGGDALKGAP